MKRFGWVHATLVVAMLCAGCGSAHGRVIRDPGTTAAATPKFDVVLNDGGLQLSSTQIKAGPYLISFRDVRTHRPPGERVALVFGPSVARIPLVTVPAGRALVATLLQNDAPWVTVDGVEKFSTGSDPLVVVPTPQYSSPVT